MCQPWTADTAQEDQSFAQIGMLDSFELCCMLKETDSNANSASRTSQPLARSEEAVKIQPSKVLDTALTDSLGAHVFVFSCSTDVDKAPWAKRVAT